MVAVEALSEEARDGETRLLQFMHDLGLAYAMHRHPPVFTVAEAKTHTAHLPGAHVKNMFLKAKDGALWLVTCLDARQIRIRDFEKAVAAKKLSFGKPDLLWEMLAVRPGSVTPLALMADRERRVVRFAIDQAIDRFDLLNCHPLHNAATLSMTPADLDRFVAACGHEAVRVDFDALEAAAAERSASADDALRD